jgi:ATP-binding cassette, subfamily G (WHITE), member 2, SNQ2
MEAHSSKDLPPQPTASSTLETGKHDFEKQTQISGADSSANNANDDAVLLDLKPVRSHATTATDYSTATNRSGADVVVPIRSGVNVERAEHEFAELSKELSRHSQRSRVLEKVQSRKSAKSEKIPCANEGKDPEKGIAADADESSASATEDEEPFDLEKTLRGNRDQEEREGIKSKRIGVLWDGLTVGGVGGVKNYVETFPMAFVSFFNVYETAKTLLGIRSKGEEFDILNNFRGVAKPGEMVLVLGRPGSGCTTFLKVISNQRFGYTKIDGEVLYGPFESSFFGKRYRGESVYCEEAVRNYELDSLEAL